MNPKADMGLAGRIRYCAKLAGGAAELCRKTGIPRRSLDNYLIGRSPPKLEPLLLIARAAGVSLDWLATGEDETRVGSHSPPEALSEDEKEADSISHAPALDTELLAQTMDGVSSIYRDEGARVSVADAARLAGPIYERIVGITDAAERRGALRYALETLRQDLRRAASQPTETKRLA